MSVESLNFLSAKALAYKLSEVACNFEQILTLEFDIVQKVFEAVKLDSNTPLLAVVYNGVEETIKKHKDAAFYEKVSECAESVRLSQCAGADELQVLRSVFSKYKRKASRVISRCRSFVKGYIEIYCDDRLPPKSRNRKNVCSLLRLEEENLSFCDKAWSTINEECLKIVAGTSAYHTMQQTVPKLSSKEGGVKFHNIEQCLFDKHSPVTVTESSLERVDPEKLLDTNPKKSCLKTEEQ